MKVLCLKTLSLLGLLLFSATPWAEELDEIDKEIVGDLEDFDDEAEQGLHAKDPDLVMLLDEPGWGQPAEHSANFVISTTGLGAILPAEETSGWVICDAAPGLLALRGSLENCHLRAEAEGEDGKWTTVPLTGKRKSANTPAVMVVRHASSYSRLRVTVTKPKDAPAILSGLAPLGGTVQVESAPRLLSIGQPREWRLVSSVDLSGPEKPDSSAGASWKAEVRVAAKEDDCSRREWVDLSRDRLNGMLKGGARFFQFRLSAGGDLKDLPPRLTLALRKQKPAQPGAGISAGYAVTGSPGGPGTLGSAFPTKRAGSRFFRLDQRRWVMEFDEPRRFNVASVLLGPGIRRARQITVEVFDRSTAQWAQVSSIAAGYQRIAVATFPEVVSHGLRVTVPWGLADVRSIEARRVPALVTSVSCPPLRFHQPGLNDNRVPVMPESEFGFRVTTLSEASSSAMLDVTLFREADDSSEEVVASSQKPITLDPDKEVEESVLLHSGRLAGNLSIRFQLRSSAEGSRPFQSLEYPAYAAPRLSARLMSPAYRNSVYSSQKIEAVEVEGLLAAPKKAIVGVKGLSIRLAIGRREFPYRLKEYRTTGMLGMRSRRCPLRLELKETPHGHFKLRVTTHAPPVMSQVGLAQDDLTIYPAAPTEVWLGEQGGIHVNDTPFFPLGYTNVPDDQKAFRSMAESGANVAHVRKATPETLARAGKVGLRVIADLGSAARIEDDGAGPEALKERLSGLKDSPFLLAWSVMASGKQVVDELARGYRVIREAAPYHPFLIFSATDADLAANAEAGDLLAGPAASGSDSIVTQNHFIEEACLIAAAHGKGVVAVIPSLPSDQLRCTAYGAIASGANGVLIDWRNWPEAGPLISELQEFLPLLSGSRTKVGAGGDEFPFPALHLSDGQREALIVVNNLPQARTLSWRSSSGMGEELHAPGRSAQPIRAVGGICRDEFGPLQARAYGSEGTVHGPR